jgi:hypothetical protein
VLVNFTPFEPGGALHSMTHYRQWLLFKQTKWDPIKQKWEKKPIQPNGYGMPWRSDPSKLLTYAEAKAAVGQRSNCTLGFVLTPQDPFFCLDIDHCLDAGGNQSEAAQELVSFLPYGIVEKSMSGDGLHVWGSTDEIPHSCKNDILNAEYYTNSRAIAITGDIYPTAYNVSLDSTLDVIALVSTHFPYATRKIKADGAKSTIERLEEAALAVPFIDPLLTYDNWLGVCMGLHAAGVEADAEETAFKIAQEYTANSPKYQPGYLEYKWGSFHADGGHTLNSLFHFAKLGGYKTRDEISAAEAFAEFTALTPPPPPVPGDIQVAVETREQGILYPVDYLPIFGECVYVKNAHCIWTPNGELLDQKRFDAEYSGYSYALDMVGRKCVDSPWETFFKCREYKFKRVHATAFRPDLPTGQIITHEGRTFVNVYWPVPIARQAGDVTLFLDHLAKILPDERDRRILLSYMAALVQSPGVKFQWAPLLQGVEGNGKTFFTDCLEAAVGSCYSHRPQAQDLDNKFNAWLVNKLLICVEDIYVSGHRANIIEALKPMITGTRAGIQGKNADQVTTSICANFIFNSNHKNALGDAVKGRRYCVFYTAQQFESDLERDGMTGAYFTTLYLWAMSGGFAHVTDYLHTYQVDAEFNPAGNCTRAPRTSAHAEVLVEALGPVEQEIMAAVTEDRPGFIGPWISSLALDRLLTSTGNDKKIPRNRRRALLESLGYVRHPHLVDGRTNNAVLPDAGKTALYVKKGHPALELQGPAVIADRYSKAQQQGGASVASAVFSGSY